MNKVISLLAMTTLITGCGEPDKGEWVQMPEREEWLKNRCIDGFNTLGNEYILEQLIDKDNKNITSFRGFFGGNIGTKRAAPLLQGYDSYTFTCSMSIVGEIPIYSSSGDKIFTYTANNIASIRFDANYKPVKDWMDNQSGIMVLAVQNEIPKDRLCSVSGEQASAKFKEVKYVPKGIREDDEVFTVKFSQFISKYDKNTDLCTVKILTGRVDAPIVATYTPPQVTDNVLEVSNEVTQQLKVIKHQDYPDSFKGIDSKLEYAIKSGCKQYASTDLTIPRDVVEKELGYYNVHSNISSEVKTLDYNKYRCTITSMATRNNTSLRLSSSYDYSLVTAGTGDFDTDGYGVEIIGSPSIGEIEKLTNKSDVEGLTRQNTTRHLVNGQERQSNKDAAEQLIKDEEICLSIFEENHDVMREQFNTYWPKAEVVLKTSKKPNIKKNINGNPNIMNCDFALTSSVGSLEPHMVFTVKTDSNRNISEVTGWSDIYDPKEDLWWSEL